MKEAKYKNWWVKDLTIKKKITRAEEDAEELKEAETQLTWLRKPSMIKSKQKQNTITPGHTKTEN